MSIEASGSTAPATPAFLSRRLSMLAYYMSLALAGFRRSTALSALAIVTIAVGIGAAMSVFAVLRAMSSVPLGGKAAQLFAVRIDNWAAPAPADPQQADQLSYSDAAALMTAQRGTRQSAMYAVQFIATQGAAGATPVAATGRAVYSDFFSMFDSPFSAGAAWTRQDEADRANVVVLGAKLAQKLFRGNNPLNATVSLNQHDYKVVGVLRPWRLQPRVYDLTTRLYSETEDVFLPFTTALERQLPSNGSIYCPIARPMQWSALLSSECRWLQFWVELPTAAAAREYAQFLHRYAADQRRSGRFSRDAATGLYDVQQWLALENLIPTEVQVSTLVAFAFMLVCLLNAIVLMLSKFTSRGHELSVRRALGASKLAIFAQCLAESAVIGVAGGVSGLVLLGVGLAVERHILREDYARLAYLDVGLVLITVLLAVFSTICTGIYPAWHASRIQPAWQLKSP